MFINRLNLDLVPFLCGNGPMIRSRNLSFHGKHCVCNISYWINVPFSYKTTVCCEMKGLLLFSTHQIHQKLPLDLNWVYLWTQIAVLRICCALSTQNSFKWNSCHNMMTAIIVLANCAMTAITSFYAKSTKIIENQNVTHRCIGNRPSFKTVFLFFLYG